MVKPSIPATDFNADSVISGSAKKALDTINATKGELYMADPDQLRPIPGFNVRVETPDYLAHIEDLALSMKANGFYPNKPLGGFAGKEDGADVIFITDGYSRRRAIVRAREMGAELGQIPVVLKPAGTSIEDLTVALVQDNEGRPLLPIERAVVAARLKGFGLTNVEIAERFGKTDRYIEDLLHLAAAPKKVRDLVVGGKISSTEAIKQVRRNPEKAAAVLESAVNTAAKAGKTKASAKHIAAAPAPAKVTPEKFNFGWTKGQVVPVEDILPVGRLGSGWWEFSDEEKTEVKILKDVTISASLLAVEPTTVTADEEITVDGAAAPAGTTLPEKSPKASPAKPRAAKTAAKKPATPAKAAKKPAAPKKGKAKTEPTSDEFAGL